MRLMFSKTGRAVYISHLDLMRTMSRAFLRADCPLKYSEGFNPHPQISIALPLSVGTESLCEIMDFRLREDRETQEIENALKDQFPEGIELLGVYDSERKTREIKWLKINGVFEYDDGSCADKAEKLNEFFAQETIVISKKTKRGVADTDIKPAISEICFSSKGEAVDLSAVISAQEPTLNPELLADALRQLKPELAPDFAKFRRIEIFDENMSVFR